MTDGVVEFPASLRSRIPVSLDGLVVTPPEFVNHGGNYDRWRIKTRDGNPVGQVRVYRGRRNELGSEEHVFIPARREASQEPFSLPHAELFSEYLRAHLEIYLTLQADETPIDAALRKGPEIIGLLGKSYFLRWNVYFKDGKIGEYTVHDFEPERQAAGEEEKNYRGRILGYTNSHVVAWNEAVACATTHPLSEVSLRVDEVVLKYGRTLAKETPDQKYTLEWKRLDTLDIPFP